MQTPREHVPPFRHGSWGQFMLIWQSGPVNSNGQMHVKLPLWSVIWHVPPLKHGSSLQGLTKSQLGGIPNEFNKKFDKNWNKRWHMR